MDNADIIIAGGGAAGLSLACRLADSVELKDKNIIIIDKDSKSTNDRTWCFWEKDESYFESIIFHKWQNLRIDGDGEILTRNIKPYSYKMLRAQDFYQFAKDKIGNKKILNGFMLTLQKFTQKMMSLTWLLMMENLRHHGVLVVYHIRK